MKTKLSVLLALLVFSGSEIAMARPCQETDRVDQIAAGSRIHMREELELGFVPLEIRQPKVLVYTPYEGKPAPSPQPISLSVFLSKGKMVDSHEYFEGHPHGWVPSSRYVVFSFESFSTDMTSTRLARFSCTITKADNSNGGGGVIYADRDESCPVMHDIPLLKMRRSVFDLRGDAFSIASLRHNLGRNFELELTCKD